MLQTESPGIKKKSEERKREDYQGERDCEGKRERKLRA